MTSHKLTTDRAAAVHDSTFMYMDTCPVGTKVILLTVGGVATISQWNGRDKSFKGWYPLPKIPKEQNENRFH